MNPTVRKVLGESVGKDQVLDVIETTKPEKILVCPHCREEIFEKHSYTDESGIDRHRDCGGAFRFPPPDATTQAFLDQLKSRK